MTIPDQRAKPQPPPTGAKPVDWLNEAVNWYYFVNGEIASMSYTENKTGIDLQVQMGRLCVEIGTLANTLGVTTTPPA